MFCKNCGCRINESDLYCVNCRTKQNLNINDKKNNDDTHNISSLKMHQLDNVIIKLVNIFRIINSVACIAILVLIINKYLELIDSSGTSFANLIFLGPLFLSSLVFFIVICFFNLTKFKINIISNIKVASIMEIISCGLILIYRLLISSTTEEYLKDNLVIITSIILVFSIIKFVLTNLLRNCDIGENIKNKNKKKLVDFVSLIIATMFGVFFVSLGIAGKNCNKSYEINMKQLTKELKSFSYVDQKLSDIDAYGFECRTKLLKTYISFKDKYNNEVILTISDYDKGELNKDDALENVANIQFANNILKKTKIDIKYDNILKEYFFEINDSFLKQYFNISIYLGNIKMQKNTALYEFDLKTIPYSVKINLRKKRGVLLDNNYVMPYVESLAHVVYENVGKERKVEFKLSLDDTTNLKIGEYGLENIIWEEYEE